MRQRQVSACPYYKSGFAVIHDTLENGFTKQEAECACQQYGWQAALIKLTDLAAVNEVLWECMGAQKAAWISGYAGVGEEVKMGKTCAAAKGGPLRTDMAMVAPKSCGAQIMAVICMRPSLIPQVD